jgi:DNA replicative helicase MCM subunit Mcm2 (Cdc46/Mcm family)
MAKASIITKMFRSKKETTIKEIINSFNNKKVAKQLILHLAANKNITSQDTNYILKRLQLKAEIYQPELGFYKKL